MFLAKSKKICVILIVLLFDLSVLLSNYQTTHAATVHVLQITGVPQLNTNWCWAAVAEMIGRYVSPGNYHTQTEIVVEIKNSANDNSLATPSEFLDGVWYADNHLKSYNYLQTTMSWAQIDNKILLGYPLNANVTFHAVLVFGTIKPDSLIEYIAFYDPKNGTSAQVTYNDFLSGIYAQNIFGEFWPWTYYETYYAS